jgi:hypothetical protein
MVTTTGKEAFHTQMKRKTLCVRISQQELQAAMDHLAYRDHGMHSPMG